MSSYEPTFDIAIWLTIRDFVNSAVADCKGQTAYNPDTLLIASSKLTAWCWETCGLPLEREDIFDRNTIANFIAVGLPESKPSARGNLRSQLLRMSEVLLGTGSLRKLAPLPPSDPSAPYNRAEVVNLRNWADSQSTPERRANAAVLLSLGLGAGLSASEIGELRVGEIVVDDDGVVVHPAGDRKRSVPVLRAWEEALIRRRSALPIERYAFRENHTSFYPNLVSNFINRSQWMKVRPQTQRLRATWIVHHLTVGTPVVLLMKAAGVESLEAFTRYVRFVPEVDVSEARGLLRDRAP